MTKLDFQHLRWKEQNRKKYFESSRDWSKTPVILNGPDYVLPFGKFKGTKLKDLPRDYVEWAILNMEDYRVNMFVRELQRRDPSYNI